MPTPIPQEVKQRSLSHVNSDHSQELLDITQVYVDEKAETAVLVDLFIEGMSIEYSVNGIKNKRYLAFNQPGSFKDNFITLWIDALKKLGKEIPSRFA